ncbi:MAG: hypothetical protein R2697_03490 [Ilumatobacteraceae bacterium]
MATGATNNVIAERLGVKRARSRSTPT